MLRIPASGSCQCGSCAFSAEAQPYIAYTCHCSDCQKLTGSAFLSCMQVPAESVRVTRGSPAIQERVADSGNVLKTWFCARCASTLFAQNSARPRIRTVHIGALDEPQSVEVSAHIWTKRKLPWVLLAQEHRNFESAGDWTEDYADDLSRYLPD